MELSASLVLVNSTTKMLIQVGLLLLSVGVYASNAYGTTASSAPTTEDALFGELDFIFPANFLSKFPGESNFFTMKIFGYLIFNMFAKYFGEHEPNTFWTKFNRNDFNRVAIDAAFYEYLTKFADSKTKHLIFDPLKSSSSSPEDIAIHRIGAYLDNLSEAEVSAVQSETRSQEDAINYYKHPNAKPSEPIHIFGVPGKDFPNYNDIPKTSFTCGNKRVPGIYADIETRCQVFHTCWPRRMDSYLCPNGTTFNQALLTCDFWQDSDCFSAPLFFDHPILFKGKATKNTEPTLATDDATQATSESSSDFTPGLDIPACDEAFRFISELGMKFLPVKCKETDLKPNTPDTTGGSSKYDVKQLNRLMSELVSGNFREMFEFLIKASELASRMQGAVEQPESKKEKPTPESDPEVVNVTTQSPLKNDDVGTTSEEQIYSSTTDLPSEHQDNIKSRVNSGFVETSVFKTTSNGKVTYSRSVRKSTLLKPSKPSEDAIKHVFETMITSLELGGRILHEGILPLVEKTVLDSRRKKSASKS